MFELNRRQPAWILNNLNNKTVLEQKCFTKRKPNAGTSRSQCIVTCCMQQTGTIPSLQPAGRGWWESTARFLSLWPRSLTFDLGIQTLPSERSNTSSLWIWRKSVQRFQRYVTNKQNEKKNEKVTDGAKKQNLRSSLLAVKNVKKIHTYRFRLAHKYLHLVWRDVIDRLIYTTGYRIGNCHRLHSQRRNSTVSTRLGPISWKISSRTLDTSNNTFVFNSQTFAFTVAISVDANCMQYVPPPSAIPSLANRRCKQSNKPNLEIILRADKNQSINQFIKIHTSNVHASVQIA